jgi:hypothetical protein
MFDNIIIRGNKSQSTNDIDVGSFAEALLFYQNVHVVLDRGSLPNLVNSIGIDNFRLLLESGFCSATFLKDAAGAQSQPINGTAQLEHRAVI